HHVHLCGSHAGPLPCRHRSRLVGSPGAQKEKGGRGMIFFSLGKRVEARALGAPPLPSAAADFRGKGGIAQLSIFLVALLITPITAQAQHPSAGSGQAFDGAKAYEYAREFAAIGPR